MPTLSCAPLESLARDVFRAITVPPDGAPADQPAPPEVPPKDDDFAPGSTEAVVLP